jgi:membrane protein YqaA with SNARE-associated domain
MEGLNEFFINYGYLGMALASFLAGTFFPFSSEVVMGALLVATDMDTKWVVVSATIGNVAGSMVNYLIGRCAKPSTVARLFKIREDRMQKSQDYVEKYGSWTALFTFLPILGTAIAIALGVLRANPWLVFLFTTIGKFTRYIIIALSVTAIF